MDARSRRGRRPRGESTRRPRPSGCRQRLLGRGSRRRPFLDDAARRGSVSRPAHPRRRPPGRADPRDRRRPRGGACRCSRQGHRPSRPQARERDGGERRAREGPRLRPGQGRHVRRGRVAAADRHADTRGHRDGDDALHVARAGAGPGAGPQDGHLLAGRDPPRDHHRPPPVSGRVVGGSLRGDPARQRSTRHRRAGRSASGPGACHQALPREGSAAANPDRTRRRQRAARRRSSRIGRRRRALRPRGAALQVHRRERRPRGAGRRNLRGDRRPACRASRTSASSRAARP